MIIILKFGVGVVLKIGGGPWMELIHKNELEWIRISQYFANIHAEHLNI